MTPAALIIQCSHATKLRLDRPSTVDPEHQMFDLDRSVPSRRADWSRVNGTCSIDGGPLAARSQMNATCSQARDTLAAQGVPRADADLVFFAMDPTFAAFLGIAAVVIVTPGQDTALTIRNTLLGGRRAGMATAFGIVVGQTVWNLAASAGLTALLVASEPAFLAVRLAGAAYLILLGAQTLWSAIRGRERDHAGTRDGSRLTGRKALRQGVLSNVGNPKMAIFFSSLLPQFVPAGHATFGAMLTLGLVFSVMTIAWLCGYVLVVARAGNLLRRPAVRRTVDAVTGTILVLFGARLATESR
jgi:threonine/homoserine/homoserine lactone efflux protein